MILKAFTFCWCSITSTSPWANRFNHRCLLLLTIAIVFFSNPVICSTISHTISRKHKLFSPTILADTTTTTASVSPSTSSCPVDFDFVRKFPATLEACRGADATGCCPSLLNILGMALSQYLRRSGIFEFPDNATASACLATFQHHLQANAITTNFLTTCFPHPFHDPAMFIQNPSLCAGITTTADWKRLVGSSPMDTSCRGDLSSQAGCQICTDDIKQVVYKLNILSSSEQPDCLYFSVIYAAAVVNTLGPLNPSTAVCLLGINPKDQQKKTHHKKILIFLCIGAGGILCLVTLILAYGFLQKRHQKSDLESLLRERNSNLMNTLASSTGLLQFTYSELNLATEDFNPKNIIGEGGFGRVYRGVLGSPAALQIAVKLIKNSTVDGDTEFLNEVEVISRVRHRNLLHLRGCCVASSPSWKEDHHHRLLVYDYMPNGNLENYLFNGRKMLSWPERRKIAIGMATGINYLHNEVEPAIIHRDIKPSNILLDAELNARVADFGLAKVAPEGISHLTTRVAGTPVYIALEYAMYGHLSDKIDVYSFGIVLLELMSGRRALDTTLENPSDYHIVDWAWRLVKQEKVLEVIDKKIRDSNTVDIMERFVYVGILCAHLLVTFRPPISQALKMLEGDCEIPAIPDRPLPYAWSKPGDTPSAYSFDSSTSGFAQSSINSIDLVR